MPDGANSVKRKRKPAQRGVQAVFTPSTDRKGPAQLVLGVFSIAAGAASWIYTSKSLGGLGLGNIVQWNPNVAAFLLPISIPLMIGGVGLSTYYLAMKRTWRASNRIESAIFELETLMAQKNGLGEVSNKPETSPVPPRSEKRRFSFGSTGLAFAFAETIILLALYGGLVQEYGSNLNMQNWIRANFFLGGYLLSYNALLGLAGVLGVVLFQLVPRKTRSKKLSQF